MNYLLVFVGGGIGASLRHLLHLTRMGLPAKRMSVDALPFASCCFAA